MSLLSRLGSHLQDIPPWAGFGCLQPVPIPSAREVPAPAGTSRPHSIPQAGHCARESPGYGSNTPLSLLRAELCDCPAQRRAHVCRCWFIFPPQTQPQAAARQTRAGWSSCPSRSREELVSSPSRRPVPGAPSIPTSRLLCSSSAGAGDFLLASSGSTSAPRSLQAHNSCQSCKCRSGTSDVPLLLLLSQSSTTCHLMPL